MQIFLSAIPILTVLIVLAGMKKNAISAAFIGFSVATLIAVLFFGATASVLLAAFLRSAFAALYVLLIIWAALLFFQVLNTSGAIRAIANWITQITEQKELQILLLAWIFSGFMQSISGFGVPVAVVVPLLIGLGFSPLRSVIAVSIGHCWAITFGSLGAAFNALSASTGIDGQILAPQSATFLGGLVFVSGAMALFALGGRSALRRGILSVCIIGTVMASVQYLFATRGMWNIAAMGASLSGLFALWVWSRKSRPNYGSSSPFSAFSGYLLLIGMICSVELILPLKKFLIQFSLSLPYPATVTTQGFYLPAGKTQAIPFFAHAGFFLLLTALILIVMGMRNGTINQSHQKQIYKNTATASLSSTIVIPLMAGMAGIMEQSGMIAILSQGVAHFFSSAFPFIAPWIGALGSFLTGSNANSNILFSALQAQAADYALISVPLILALQTAGGAIGAILAPSRIVLGCSAAGLTGKEGKIAQVLAIYCALILAMFGIIGWLLTQIS